MAPPPSRPALKLFYFDVPGRAEVSRLMLAYAGIPFEDVRVSNADWGALKPTMPFGTMPVLDVDGRKLAQSVAVHRYVATLAGLMPSDPWGVAKADEVLGFMHEHFELLEPTYGIKDVSEKIRVRQEIVDKAMHPKLAKLEALLGDRAFFGGDEPNYADFNVFCGLCNLSSGFFDGLPTTLLDSHPGLKAYHTRMATLPPVAKRYQDVAPGSYAAAWKARA